MHFLFDSQNYDEYNDYHGCISPGFQLSEKQLANHLAKFLGLTGGTTQNRAKKVVNIFMLLLCPLLLLLLLLLQMLLLQ